MIQWIKYLKGLKEGCWYYMVVTYDDDNCPIVQAWDESGEEVELNGRL